jgi:2-methylisocitrate lyase-like PEP mutase family enzyme
MVDNGTTPSIFVAEAQEMGFRIIIFPLAGISPALKAIKTTYTNLKKEGATGAEADDSKAVVHCLRTLRVVGP